MEILAIIGAIVVLYALWKIIEGFLITTTIKEVIITLQMITKNYPSKDDIIELAKKYNLDYHIDETLRTHSITLNIPTLPGWQVVYYYDTGMAFAAATLLNKFSGITLYAENGFVDRVRYDSNIPITNVKEIFLAKLPFYGVNLDLY